ncbi:MAG: LLM class F420-dependent oxidoreductase [Pseudomonadales bacterium]
MKIGVTAAFSHRTEPGYIAQAVRLYETAGFHSIWVPEHVVFFADYDSKYPYSDSGRIPGEPDGVLDPFTALTYIAAHTDKIRLGTGICLVPQRQPIYTAKMVADLDYLSNGRVDFGVGIGWLREEFDVLQMDFDKRNRRCLEYIEAIRALWQPGLSSYQGETLNITPCHLNPKPVQQLPPVYFGGESNAALRRVATHGDGWYGFNLSPEKLAERLQRLDQLLQEANRSRADVKIYVGPNTQPVTPETVAAYRELGVEQLLLPVMAGSLDKLKARIDKARAQTDMN